MAVPSRAKQLFRQAAEGVMLRRESIIAVLTAAVFGVAACGTPGPKVVTDAAPGVNLAEYRTYSWIYDQPPTGMNPLLYERVRASIDRELAARGLSRAEPAQIAVAFTLGSRDRVEVDDFGPYGASFPRAGFWGYRTAAYNSTWVREVSDGTLVIDLYDVSTRRPLWHGVATQRLNSAEVSQAEVDAAVAAVVARIPVASAPAAS